MTLADAKQRFSNRVADYLRYRPGYPPAVLDLLRTECGLRADHIIADIGSGTGLLSQLFLKNGHRLFGVEPNRQMREAGEKFLDRFQEFTSVPAAQAFHWFERHAARREFRRILKPGGWVVVLWNDRRMEEAPLTREYEGVLERFGIDYQRVKDSYPESADIRGFFDGGVFTARDLPNYQILDWEGFRGRLGSSSFAPTEDHPHYAPMMAELERIFRQHQQDGSVRMEYFTRIYFGQLRADRD